MKYITIKEAKSKHCPIKGDRRIKAIKYREKGLSGEVVEDGYEEIYVESTCVADKCMMWIPTWTGDRPPGEGYCGLIKQGR